MATPADGSEADGSFDVVVIGGGHNGLVAACYLARAGLSTCVVERDAVLGGAVSTVERFPGYAVDRGSSLHIMVRWTGLVDELALDEGGLTYRDCDPWAFLPVPGAPGGGLTFWVDVDRTCAGIAAACGQVEADRYARFVAEWLPRGERMIDAFVAAPTPARLGRALVGLGRAGGGRPSGGEMARQFLLPGDALLDEAFGDERLRTALAWLGSQAGPPLHLPGTAPLVGWLALLHRHPPGRPVGGSGALTQALAARLAATGGQMRTGDAAVGIETAGGRVRAVRTASGSRLRCRAAVAACHILATCDLLRDALPPEALAGIRDRVHLANGLGIAVRVGARELPAYPDAPPEVAHGMALAVGSRDELRAAYGDYLSGRPPSRPPVVAMGLSRLDPSLAPPDRAHVSLWSQWHPYRLGSGNWEDQREAAGAAVLAAVERVAPGWRDSLEHVHVQTPLDLERELGLPNGDVMHLPSTLETMFALRPLPELAGYRGPVDGLYLCGASTHPGGGVFGASGRSAARTLLADLGLRGDGRPARLRRAAARIRRARGAAAGLP